MPQVAHKRTKRCGKWRTNQWYPLEESKMFKFTPSNCSASGNPAAHPAPHHPVKPSVWTRWKEESWPTRWLYLRTPPTWASPPARPCPGHLGSRGVPFQARVRCLCRLVSWPLHRLAPAWCPHRSFKLIAASKRMGWPPGFLKWILKLWCFKS